MKRRTQVQRRPGLGRSGSGKGIGLDIGATSVRAVEVSVSATDGRPTAALQRVASEPLPPGTVVKGVVEDPVALTEAVKALWKNGGFGGHDVVLGVASPQVVVRDLQIPAMDAGQRAKALPFLAKDVIALPIDSVVLDFVPLGGPQETGTVEGLLVATPREPVLAAVTAVERAGLRVSRVDLSSFAVLRSTAQDDLDIEAVVDLGAQLTTIVIHRHGVPRLVRTLARGGQEVTDRLADRLGVSPEEAETLKREQGLSGASYDTGLTLRECLRPLLSEIRSSINYFRTSNAGAGVERLALTGGGSALPGLAEALADQTGVPTVVVSPLQYLGDWWDAVSEPDGAPKPTGQAATSLSVGLAMGAAA